MSFCSSITIKFLNVKQGVGVLLLLTRGLLLLLSPDSLNTVKIFVLRIKWDDNYENSIGPSTSWMINKCLLNLNWCLPWLELDAHWSLDVIEKMWYFSASIGICIGHYSVLLEKTLTKHFNCCLKQCLNIGWLKFASFMPLCVGLIFPFINVQTCSTSPLNSLIYQLNILLSMNFLCLFIINSSWVSR